MEFIYKILVFSYVLCLMVFFTSLGVMSFYPDQIIHPARHWIGFLVLALGVPAMFKRTYDLGKESVSR